ncbi:unnamed protein product [Chilo suppressalis]|uniref:Alpha-tubulin N-acetyltransferase n=1 Tax=Chilo suppressalis TaxID=168631 RepID=A0ABN8B359_CHISP|nr:hypothetical protein evm_007486 [Chilo suppressalis]CAH0401802.1 unnamed protein product [Chilo suppressalis]
MMPLPINEILKEEITKLNYTLIPPGFQGDVRSVRLLQESLAKMIDYLGEQSASAQGLTKVITTAERLRNSPSYVLYLLKDAAANNGKGEVIGLLKVGRKHLFLFDSQDKVCEVEPLCVLDFFVVGDRQRHGYGRVLFDHMLQDMQINPSELAIDGPSPKMEKFLLKNYGITKLIRQSNNFAVSPSFFTQTGSARNASPDVADAEAGRNKRTPDNAAPERYATPEPPAPAKLEVKPSPEMVSKQAPILEMARPTERPSTLEVGPPPPAAMGIVGAPSPAPSSAGSVTSRPDSQLTSRGFFDMKFYHNKLW